MSEPSKTEFSKYPKALLWGFLAGCLLMGFATCFRGSEPAAPSAPAPSDSQWTCSMHPEVRQAESGSCPLCGMDLVQVDAQAQVVSRHSVALSARAKALARLETVRVVSRPGATHQIELSGQFSANGMLLHTISTPREGWIDQLTVDAPGRAVVRGDLLARIYVPGVFEAHRDLLDGQRKYVSASLGSRANKKGLAQMERAKKQLRALGASEDAITFLQDDEDAPSRSLPICSPYTGTILKRYLNPGAFVLQGQPIFQIADLSALWLLLDVHEKDLPWVTLGDHVEVVVDAAPHQTFQGIVSYLDETVDPKHRTATARVHINNPTWKIRTGMFARARLTPQASKGSQGRLVIPATAPLFTGKRAVVYLEIKQGEDVRYEPRTVRLGHRRGDVYPVIAGLQEGDRVVSRGAFVLDADLQIRGGPSMMAQGDDRHDDPRFVPSKLSAQELELLRPLFYYYLEVQATLAADNLQRVKHSEHALSAAIDKLDLSKAPAAQKTWLLTQKALQQEMTRLRASSELSEHRVGFERLSHAVIGLLARHGNPLPYGLRLAYCPMAFDNAGAYWVQKNDSILNSYFGAQMLRCGEIRQRLDPGDFLMVPSDLERAPHPGEHR